MPQYDYIFTGAGAAALSLITRMVDSGKFANKKILLIDRSEKTKNDRTWCFWEKDNGYFENLVYKQWQNLSFHCPDYSKELDNYPYRYKMIRGIDFYNYCLKKINDQPNINRLYGEVELRLDSDSKLIILVDQNPIDIEGAIIFNSIYKGENIRGNDIHYLQHFKGWIINTHSKKFDAAKAVLMDFRVHQRNGTSFVYVLPLSENRLLVEYTLFSPELLRQDQYDTELKHYVSQILQIDDYNVEEEEFGIIPMTTAKFNFEENGYFNIGTAGGQTKASSGYTFQFIQKQADRILRQMISATPIRLAAQNTRRFNYYDHVLLEVLAHSKLNGDQVFGRLFSRNKGARVFKFLDNETSLAEEIKIMSTLQFIPFLKAGWRALI